MTLTLVVETGAGLSNANSYATEDEGDAYHDTKVDNAAWFDLDKLKKMAGLIEATRELDLYFRWYGYRATTAQALRHPRTGLIDRDGRIISSTIIAPALKNATAELARMLNSAATTKLAETGIPMPDTAALDRLKVGPVELDFDATLSVSGKAARANAVTNAAIVNQLVDLGEVRLANFELQRY